VPLQDTYIHMQKTILKTTIDNMAHDGRGIGVIDGKKIFLANALPGEEVTFCYTRKHNNYDEGKVIEVLISSPHRVNPKCPHFAICGGCCMQHLEHTAQLELKQRTLLEQLQHFGGLQPKTILPPITDAIWNYRTKGRLGVKFVNKKNKLLVGFHEKEGRYIADIESCCILHASISDKIKDLANLIMQLSIYQYIPQIEVAAADEGTALIFRHMQEPTSADLEKILAFAKQNDFRIYLQPKGLDSIHCITQHSSYLQYKLPAQNLEFLFQPTDFTQINQNINKKMVRRALELLTPEPEETVLDLFCGIGNFSLPLAQACQHVTGVEGSIAAVQRAIMNAAHNNIKNTAFYHCDLDQETINAPWMEQKFTKILIDPPRTGALNMVKQMAKFKAKKIVYVSCNPATLARDGKELAEQGYALTAVGIIDMFPHTSHTEAIALFEQN
jgi:23S rRNA (uracil1939-C5)-methyltransferase